ncbi:hypothetical protein DSO57_1030693 [Entomophthora muscae]|uniref:Uncharacterized protein n=1 Tax=Entomophthora muscae TaxID=34485 RepID=A0ACC2TMU7_9FUNG|nr:hypothetical protein DSO57_1030693 [Entomophthora muscae]
MAVEATAASLLPWADASTPLLELIAQLQVLTVSSNLTNKPLLSAVKSVKNLIAVLEFPVETDIEPTCPTGSIVAPAPKPTPTQPAPTQELSSMLPISVTKYKLCRVSASPPTTAPSLCVLELDLSPNQTPVVKEVITPPCPKRTT